MALINCPECGNQMSDTAKKCPHCGYKEKKINKNIILGITLIILGIGALIISEFQLTMSRLYGYYTCDDEHFISAIILYLVMLGCGIWSAIIFYKQNKLISKVLIGLMSVAILVLLYQFTIDSKLSTSDEIRNREYQEYLTSKENEPTDTVKILGLDFIRKVMKNENISITRYQYLNEEKCAQDDSPFKQLDGLSMGFYDLSIGGPQVWVFFKNGEPRYMCRHGELSDSDIILHLIALWDDRSQSEKDLDRIKSNTYQEIQADPSYQRMMKRVRGY